MQALEAPVIFSGKRMGFKGVEKNRNSPTQSVPKGRDNL